MRIRYTVWLSVLGAGLLAGLYTMVRLFLEGHILFNANDVIIWTLPIGSYVFFALTSSGLGLLSSLGFLFGVQIYKRAGKRLVLLAIAAVLAAFVSVGLELGSLNHIYYIFLSPNFGSPIQIMGSIYSIELVCLLGKFWRLHVNDAQSGVSKLFGIGSFVCSIFAPLVLGSVFGITEARPTFFGSFLPVLCLVIAIVSGVAAFMVYTVIYSLVVKGPYHEANDLLLEDLGVKHTFTLFIALLFYLLWAILRSATSLPDFATDVNFALALFLFIPFAMGLVPAIRSSHWGKLVAGGLTLITIFKLHMEVLLGGQVRPVGPKAEGLPAVLSYSPSIWEYLVLVFSLAVLLSLATFAEKYLRLDAEAA